MLYRWDAPLFFANAARFRDRAMHFVARGSASPWIVVAAEPITDVDATAATALKELLDELDANHVVFAFAELKGPRMGPAQAVRACAADRRGPPLPDDRHCRQGIRPAHGYPLGRPVPD